MTTRLSLVLRHPQLKSLYAFWVSRCDEDALPMAEDIEPADLRPWIGNLVVMDVQRAEQGGGYAYAYYSSGFASAFGDKAGRTIDDLPEDQRALIKAEYDRVRSERIPTSRVYTADFADGRQTWERLVLPFFDPDGAVVKLLVAAYRLPA
ncbi:PAS domain-containing protein [Caenispirillum bisanense]|uniref:PAS domain-containing protein n=1 Tax=Caenispirillum bisanense TaxID=414052 RepID=UPI0031CEC104